VYSTAPFDRVPTRRRVVTFFALNVASKSGLLNLSAFVGTTVTSPAAGATCGTIAFVAAVFVYTTGTLASFAFLMSA